MKIQKGDVVKCNGEIGIVLEPVQVAWGANRYRILFATGKISHVWDKHLERVDVISETR